MAGDLLLGLDIGTTNTKAVVYEPATGKVVAVASRPTATHHPRPEWSEYDPAELWANIAAVIREASAGRAERIRAVAAGSMAEAGVPIDKEGNYLYNIIVWHDLRTEPQARRWHEWLGNKRGFEITGHPIQAKWSVNKLMWLREHAPQAYGRIHKWLCMQDFATYKLSGAYATDYSLASRTYAFDQRARDWSREILDKADLSPDLFPTAHPAGTPVGQVTAAAAAETGLRAGTVVTTGGHDHLAGSFAAGATGPGTVANSMGTAEANLLMVADYAPTEAMREQGYCHYLHVVPGHYVVHFGNVASGGLLEWTLRQLWPELDESAAGRQRVYAAAFAAAAEVPVGSRGVFCLPYLRGAGSPWFDDRAMAGFVGLRDGHGRGHIVRAAVEALCYGQRENLQLLGGMLDVPSDRDLVAYGGSTRSSLWMQIKADVTGRRVRVVELEEAVAQGAALLAGVGAGVFPTYQAAADSVERTTVVYEPIAAHTAEYARYFEAVYVHLYRSVRELNCRIHDTFWGGAESDGKK
ncbi:MAG: FGGY-family carbohydrate kinase [Chloroflexota bacterium]